MRVRNNVPWRWSPLFISLGLAGCASLADLQDPRDPRHFVLSSDYTRVSSKGLKPVEGLRAGVYRAVKEDAEGTYFEGYGEDCVLILAKTYAAKYQATGKVDSYLERRVAGENYGGGRGGIWLPKSGVNKEARLFYSIENANGHDALHKISAGTVYPSGIVLGTIVSATQGALGFVPYGSEVSFLSSLSIVPGNGSAAPCQAM